jgi:hypothetical protein
LKYKTIYFAFRITTIMLNRGIVFSLRLKLLSTVIKLSFN